MNTVPVLSWEWADWIEPAIYQINDLPLVTPVYVGEDNNPAWRLMEQLSGWSHSELWHKIGPYSASSARHQLLQRWTITQVVVVADATERKAQEDQMIKTLRPPLNRHHLFERYRYLENTGITGLTGITASAKHSKLDAHTSTRGRWPIVAGHIDVFQFQESSGSALLGLGKPKADSHEASRRNDT
jgi:hypothetical protein